MSVSHEIFGAPPPTLWSFGAPTMSRGPYTKKSLQFNPSAGKLKYLQTCRHLCESLKNIVHFLYPSLFQQFHPSWWLSYPVVSTCFRQIWIISPTKTIIQTTMIRSKYESQQQPPPPSSAHETKNHSFDSKKTTPEWQYLLLWSLE